MRHLVVPICVAAVVLSAGCLSRTYAQADSTKPKSSDGPHLRVPDGFVVEPVAEGLGLRFPMFAAFADDGRLFVAESSGGDLHAELKAGARNSRIRVLMDTNDDWQFDAAPVFADKLVCPMGLAWRDDKLYVADPPDVIVFTDDNADGRADRRRVILTGFGHQTNGSLHGLIFGLDGMLYMTMGSPDGYSLKARDGTTLQGDSGALIRCRPDGSEPEVLSRGFVNLIEVAFTSRGDIIGTDNWFQVPSGGMRDALVHLVDGGLYPYLADTVTRYPATGIELPPITLYPAVALSGLSHYSGSTFPADMLGELFSAQFNARKVARHKLVARGSTFRTADQDFVTTDDPDFHPSDVVESADGSLIVIDTGSWYVEHCPTGRIRDVDAPGGIHRVRYADAPAVKDPWGRRLSMDRMSPEQLAELLDDPRSPVRERAGRVLSAAGAKSVPALSAILDRPQSLAAKQQAIWSLATNPDRSALMPLRKLLAQNDPEIVIPAIRAVRLHGDKHSSAVLARLLSAQRLTIRLAAAEALARVGDSSAIPGLWKALGDQSDPILDHAIVHAVHRLADEKTLQQALQNPNPNVQAAALRLLDQPPRPRDALGHDVVLARFNSRHQLLRRAAREILVLHPEWASHCVDLLHKLLKSPGMSQRDRQDLQDLLLAFQNDEQIQHLIATAIQSDDVAIQPNRRVLLLDVISRTTLPVMPESWVAALAAAMDQSAPEVRFAAVRCAAVLQLRSLDDQLERLANSPAEPSKLRREALRAIAPRRIAIGPESFRLLAADISGDDPLLRLAAAEVFGKTWLDAQQLTILLPKLQDDALISPAVMLPMIERSVSPETSALVLTYLQGSIRNGWRPSPDTMAGLLPKLAQADRQRLTATLQTTQGNDTAQQFRLAEFLPLLEGGNAERGRAVFLSTKTACSTCHRVGSEGGQIGPDLTSIGSIRAGRDILESILFPGSTIAQGFDQYTLVTTDGRLITGIMAQETAETIVLRDSSGAETRLRRDQVEEVNRQPTSMMPEGLDRLISSKELRDLLAYLQAQR